MKIQYPSDETTEFMNEPASLPQYAVKARKLITQVMGYIPENQLGQAGNELYVRELVRLMEEDGMEDMAFVEASIKSLFRSRYHFENLDNPVIN